MLVPKEIIRPVSWTYCITQDFKFYSVSLLMSHRLILQRTTKYSAKP